MEGFSHRSTLYRSLRCLVILGVLLPLAQGPVGQVSRGAKSDKGPRALGLLQILPGGKAHIIPVAILVDGTFYDASAYKASPVPMALWAETEYEGLKAGISEGLFTCAGALQNQQTKDWIGEGSWLTSAELAAKGKAKKHVSSEPRGLNQDEGPPVLRHSGAKPKPPEPSSTPSSSAQTASSQPAQSTPAPSQPAPSTSSQASPPSTSTPTAPSQGSPPPSAPTNSNPPAAPVSAPTEASTTQSASPAPSDWSAGPVLTPESQDPNRPSLKRGKPSPTAPEPLPTTTPTRSATLPKPAAAPATATTAQVQLIPAISDSDGPDPHSYAFPMKTEDEQEFQKKMLQLAADQVRARITMLSGGSAVTKPSSPRAKQPKPPTPTFDNIQLHVFDLFSSNEPILVLSATARMLKASPNQDLPAELQYFVTLVARQDINGDFHKAFSVVTDQQHLDVEPRYEFIDAVDADGDGRGELLFRKVYDAGTAYVIYRVIGDQLYPLFDGTPSS
jgi:hypothetical protein